MTGNSSRRALVPLDKYCLAPYLASRVTEEPSISTRSRMCSSLVVECRDWAGSAVRPGFRKWSERRRSECDCSHDGSGYCSLQAEILTPYLGRLVQSAGQYLSNHHLSQIILSIPSPTLFPHMC